jgi:hypothetical protein
VPVTRRFSNVGFWGRKTAFLSDPIGELIHCRRALFKDSLC